MQYLLQDWLNKGMCQVHPMSWIHVLFSQSTNSSCKPEFRILHLTLELAFYCIPFKLVVFPFATESFFCYHPLVYVWFCQSSGNCGLTFYYVFSWFSNVFFVLVLIPSLLVYPVRLFTQLCVTSQLFPALQSFST